MSDQYYSDAASYRELSTAVSAAIDLQISQHITDLISCDASRHDKLAGMIAGLRKAQKLLQETATKYARAAHEEPQLKLVTLGDTKHVEVI